MSHTKERIKKDIETVAAKKGWTINPERLDEVAEGLDRNLSKYGRRLCPCQFYANGIWSLNDICPCEAMRTTGSCHCDLYKEPA